MLLKANITNIEMLSDDWYNERKGKLTSSNKHFLMGEKPDTQGAISYLYRQVGEEITQVAARDEVDTKATEHGKKYEPIAIRAFRKQVGWDDDEKNIVVTQKLIKLPGTKRTSTPDIIIPYSETNDKKGYNVITGEVKCPPSYDHYIALFRCNTPEDVLHKVSTAGKIYFWQTIDQMDVCGALTGYLIIYHPFFVKAGGLNIIEFRKKDMMKYFTLLEQRNKWAEEEFDKIRTEIIEKKIITELRKPFSN